MSAALLRLVRRWLRLPPDPAPPAGSPGSVRVFRAARNFYRYALARWTLNQIGVLIGFLFVLTFGQMMLGWVPIGTDAATEVIDELPWPVRGIAVGLRLLDADERGYRFGPGIEWLERGAFVLFLLQLPLSYAVLRLDYELRWYIVTDRSLRVREGVTRLRESTMTFENIQNVSIRQGPIQRALGIADVRVRTAGGGSKGDDAAGEDAEQDHESMHVAILRGVEDAPGLRDVILGRLRERANPTEPVAAAPRGDGLDAARRVLDEARGLRRALAAPGGDRR